MRHLHIVKGRAVDWSEWHIERTYPYTARYLLRELWRLSKRNIAKAVRWPASVVRGWFLGRDMRVMRKEMADYREECRRKREALELEARGAA